MTSQSIRDLKDAVFGQEGPSTELLIQLAPFLTEPLLSRSISIANAVSDPFQRALILIALAGSAQLSEDRRGALVKAALDAANEISSLPKKRQVLEKILPLASGMDLISVKAQLQQDTDWELFSWQPDTKTSKVPLRDVAWQEDFKSKSSQTEDHKKQEWPSKGISEKIASKRKTPAKSERKVTKSYLQEKIADLGDDERSDLAREALVRLQTRTVNTGFAPSSQSDAPLDPSSPLKPGRPYYFWLDIGRPTLHSIETTPTEIPDYIPPKARLVVALFPFDDEIEIFPEADVGELELKEDGTAVVLRQPQQALEDIEVSEGDLLNRRLLFPVRAPGKEGTFRLRCNIYYRQILIQSRLVRAVVARDGLPREGALRSDIDYALSHTLWAEHLQGLAPHRLSILLNSNGDGTHTLSFLGAEGDDLFKNSAVIPATELKIPIENARKGLWKASWGEERPWKENAGLAYRYADRFGNEDSDLKRLEEDLIFLARRGYLLYNAIIGKFTRSRSKTYELARLMLNPGMVQVAIRDSPTQILPAALFYDYPLDTQADGHKLCEAFTAALRNGFPLHQAACFNGQCPHSKGDASGKPDGYICPSGFWGFRHSLGFPTSVPEGMDVPLEIPVDNGPRLTVGVATNLDRLDGHMTALKNIRTDIVWSYSKERQEILNNLKSWQSHVIYFYCHGGVTANNVPYLQVGDGKGSDFIDGSNLLAYRILWDGPNPLVFINGCHTTALDPEKVINLVADFVSSGSAGVIGTEITIFEPLACSFAEACLGHFLKDKSSIGEAIRMARLKLLGEYNPLGLVYTPFVLPSLHIKEND